jgi:hypothetical protein
MPISLQSESTTAPIRAISTTTQKPRSSSTLPFAAAIFLSAFLLFQVQLLLGKQILPIFGGAPAVWTACLLFFQLALLAGYIYSHAVAANFSIRRQSTIQITLLVVTVATLGILARLWPTPITPDFASRAVQTLDPTFAILAFLAAAIGLPFFLLSTTSPLLQHWYAKTSPGISPYRLYALSNVGSLLGLLSYPFLVEPNLHLRTQSWLWVAAFALYAILYAACAILASRTQTSDVAQPSASRTPSTLSSLGWKLPAQWILFAATASTLLMASTNLICQEVAVVPFLWVFPLSLYLLSFILCFESDRWYRPNFIQAAFAISAACVVLVSLPNTSVSFVLQVAAYSALLFFGCMLCHGEAARIRPAPQFLTAFYLCIALGGAIGGIFVSFLAPHIFPGYWEFPIAVLICLFLILDLPKKDTTSWWHRGRLSLALLLFSGMVLLTPAILAPLWKPVAQLPRALAPAIAVALAFAAVITLIFERRRPDIASNSNATAIHIAARVALALLTAGLMISQKAEFYHVIARSRNFYGMLSVIENREENYLALRHGKTTHGYQYLDAARAHQPTGYYGPGSGANAVITDAPPQHPLRVGLVGMGAGTLAAIGRPGDLFRFYEINPDVYKWSSGPTPYFTYLRDSHAKIEVEIGDGRLVLAQEAARGQLGNYDLLVLDAFSSDAIPMHLLTREAFELYLRHLRGPDSVIAVHISNNSLDLRPVLLAIANEFHFQSVDVTPFLPNGPLSQSEWILLSRNPASLNLPSIKSDSAPIPATVKPLLWTDDYSNLFRLLRH